MTKDRLIRAFFLLVSLLLLVFSWSCLQYAGLAQEQGIAGAQAVEAMGVLIYVLFLLPLVYLRIGSLKKPKWLMVFGFFPPAMLVLCFYLTFTKKEINNSK